jgi:hypothetical protein
MTSITLYINEKTKKGKALLAFLKAFCDEKETVHILEESKKNPYKKVFVEKIQKARAEIKKGKTIAIETDSIWESIK